MKKSLVFNIVALMAIAALCLVLMNRTTTTDQRVITLQITDRGDFVQPPPIEETCEEKYREFHRKAFDLEREVEHSLSITNCSLVESRIGHSKAECGIEVSSGGCAICRLRCGE